MRLELLVERTFRFAAETQSKGRAEPLELCKQKGENICWASVTLAVLRRFNPPPPELNSQWAFARAYWAHVERTTGMPAPTDLDAPTPMKGPLSFANVLDSGPTPTVGLTEYLISDLLEDDACLVLDENEHATAIATWNGDEKAPRFFVQDPDDKGCGAVHGKWIEELRGRGEFFVCRKK